MIVISSTSEAGRHNDCGCPANGVVEVESQESLRKIISLRNEDSRNQTDCACSFNEEV